MSSLSGLSLKFWDDPKEDICLIFSEPSDDVLISLLGVLKSSQRLSGGILKQIDALLGLNVKAEFNDGDIYDEEIGNESLEFNIKTEVFDVFVDKEENDDNNDDFIDKEDNEELDLASVLQVDLDNQDCDVKNGVLKNEKEKPEKEKKEKRGTPNTPENTTCKECNKRFKFPALLRRHLFVHTGVKDYSCDSCGYKSSNIALLNSHKKRNHNDLWCKRCKLYFRCKEVKDEHECALERISHPCNECEKTFKNKVDLLIHVDSVHKGIKHVCDECGDEFTVQQSLRRHKKTAHGNLPPEFQCHLCPAAFILKEKLKVHFKIHDGSASSGPCPHCGKKFSTKASLGIHINAIHLKKQRYFCNVCEKGFMFPSELREHIDLEHLGSRPHVCDVCSADFKTHTGLKQHIVVKHTAEGREKCPHCSAMFNKRTLARHVLDVHEKHKWSFECKTCGEKCARLLDLRNHMRGHSDVKPFSCKDCGERFIQKHNIKHHVKKHHFSNYKLIQYDAERDLKLDSIKT